MVDPMARALSFLGGVRSVRGVRADFVPRIGGMPVTVDKWESLRKLEPAHRERVTALGFVWDDLWRAEQVHGDGIAVAPRASGGAGRLLPNVDGLLTSGEQGALLGIYVADCAAIFLADRETGALGLIHSGKKGTEQEIVLRGIEMMRSEFGTQVDDLEVAISPCIRPPHYEVDISVQIEGQLLGAGIPREQVTMSGVCTGAEVANYYSYRMESGKTGRMLALLGRKGDTPGA
jgi:copper oxidase (laccase) domain-containing protein